MNKLYGAILGDLAGQPYEYKYKGDFSDFNLHNPNSHITDDSIMTLASADAVLHNIPFAEVYKNWYNLYPDDKYGYGSNFKAWCEDHPEAYTNSYGNGCIMRLAPVIYTMNWKRELVLDSINCTHNHMDSRRAGIMLELFYRYRDVIFMGAPILDKFCINAMDTLQIISAVYNLQRHPNTQRLIERIINLGGDTDTNASIIGELSNYINDDITKDDIEYVRSKLDNYQLEILDKFNKKYDINRNINNNYNSLDCRFYNAR